MAHTSRLGQKMLMIAHTNSPGVYSPKLSVSKDMKHDHNERGNLNEREDLNERADLNDKA